MQKFLLLTFLLFSKIAILDVNAMAASQNRQITAPKNEQLAQLKPFDKTVKWSLIIGAIATPVGFLISQIGTKTAIGTIFIEIGGGLLGLTGLLLLTFGLLFWCGRWLVRRHFRLPEKKRKRQWLVYLGGLVALILLGFLLVLEVPFWF